MDRESIAYFFKKGLDISNISEYPVLKRFTSFNKINFKTIACQFICQRT